jgi:hypothetical protein
MRVRRQIYILGASSKGVFWFAGPSRSYDLPPSNWFRIRHWSQIAVDSVVSIVAEHGVGMSDLVWSSAWISNVVMGRGIKSTPVVRQIPEAFKFQHE